MRKAIDWRSSKQFKETSQVRGCCTETTFPKAVDDLLFSMNNCSIFVLVLQCFPTNLDTKQHSTLIQHQKKDSEFTGTVSD